MLQIRKEHRLGIFTLLACVFSTHAAPSLAASIYDPSLDWRTIESPRFDVHYPDEPGYRNLAIRISGIAEGSLDKVAELAGFMPDGRIDVVISDFSEEILMCLRASGVVSVSSFWMWFCLRWASTGFRSSGGHRSVLQHARIPKRGVRSQSDDTSPS